MVHVPSSTNDIDSRTAQHYYVCSWINNGHVLFLCIFVRKVSWNFTPYSSVFRLSPSCTSHITILSRITSIDTYMLEIVKFKHNALELCCDMFVPRRVTCNFKKKKTHTTGFRDDRNVKKEIRVHAYKMLYFYRNKDTRFACWMSARILVS